MQGQKWRLHTSREGTASLETMEKSSAAGSFDWQDQPFRISDSKRVILLGTTKPVLGRLELVEDDFDECKKPSLVPQSVPEVGALICCQSNSSSSVFRHGMLSLPYAWIRALSSNWSEGLSIWLLLLLLLECQSLLMVLSTWSRQGLERNILTETLNY